MPLPGMQGFPFAKPDYQAEQPLTLKHEHAYKTSMRIGLNEFRDCACGHRIRVEFNNSGDEIGREPWVGGKFSVTNTIVAWHQIPDFKPISKAFENR